MRFVIRATWSAPITPTPRTAMRRSDIVVPVLLLAEFHGGNTARAEILAGALGDRQRCGDFTGVHVLFDDREDGDAELVDGFEQRRYVGDSTRRLGHRAELDRFTERKVLGDHLHLHLRVDLLEVQIADPSRGALDDRDVVTAAVADVAGVQTQIHALAVAAVEKAVDVLLG